MPENAPSAESVVLVRDGEPVTREAFRREQLALIPEGYSPLAHLVVPSVIGLSLVAGSLLLLRDTTALDVWFVPLVFMMSNAIEWRAHKHLLHRRTWPLEILYDRHTPIHHRIYMTDDMAMRSRREFFFVLIPAYGIVAVALAVLPIAAVLFALHQRNLACLFVATTMGYVVSYEWLHLAYHMPETSFVGRLWIVRALRRHHAVHHDPRLMQKWNFNVTVPLWDWVRSTVYRGPPA